MIHSLILSWPYSMGKHDPRIWKNRPWTMRRDVPSDQAPVCDVLGDFLRTLLPYSEPSPFKEEWTQVQNKGITWDVWHLTSSSFELFFASHHQTLQVELWNLAPTEPVLHGRWSLEAPSSLNDLMQTHWFITCIESFSLET